MIDAATRQLLTGSIAYCLCMGVLLFLRLLPLSTGAAGWAGPDIGLCLTFAWVLRRPDQLAAPLIAAIFLIEDIMLLRPLGLWAAIVLMGTEAARRREQRWRDQSFMVEWMRIALLMGAMLMACRIVAVILLMPKPALGQAILQYIATLAAYPVVVFLARWLIGLRHVSPAQAEMKRHFR